MTEIRMADLATMQPGDYHAIDAITPEGDTRRVWARGELIPFTDPKKPAQTIRAAWISVPSLHQEHLEPVLSALDRVAPAGTHFVQRMP
jgi:hypothetical protein